MEGFIKRFNKLLKRWQCQGLVEDVNESRGRNKVVIGSEWATLVNSTMQWSKNKIKLGNYVDVANHGDGWVDM